MTSTSTRAAGAIAGLVAGGVAVASGMLAAAITDVVSPVDAVGSEVIDRTPRWLKEAAIRWFDTDNKLALRIGIFSILTLAALALGVVAVRRTWLGLAGIAAFGVVGALAAVNRPDQAAGAAAPSIIGAAVGAAVLARTLRASAVETPGPSRAPLGWDRRRFLVTSGATAAAAVAAGGLAQALERRRVDEIVATTQRPLPPAVVSDTVTVPLGADGVNPATPFITPNDGFYRIDTALSFPRVRVESWKFDITGMVDRPLTIDYEQLLAMPQVERVVTLTCVSNEVGGPYVGNAVWRGVLLRDILDQAGVRDDAEQVYSTSLDGWTCGFPVAAAFDGRDAMVVVGMNGETLPLAHGYPARLVVPGLYGYVSATKWLSQIELTTWDKRGYWVPQGWSQQAPIKTQSRIDVPRRNQTLAIGAQKIAGVAWAQHRGIARVEVRVDGGAWLEAQLASDVSDDAWRQWVLDWDAPAGNHVIEVRATDKQGDTQTEERAEPAPDGATGYHTIKVKVI